MLLQCLTLLVSICGGMAWPCCPDFDGYAHLYDLGKDDNWRKNVFCFCAYIDRSLGYIPSPTDFIPTGLRARCWQCPQGLSSRHWRRCPHLNGSSSDWIEHYKNDHVCDRISQDHGETNA